MAHHHSRLQRWKHLLARHLVARLQSLVLEGLHSRTCRRTVLKKSRGRLGILNATKREGSEVALGSIVLELVGLGHRGGTSLMLVVELGRCEVCLGGEALAFMSSCSALRAPMYIVVVEGLVVLEEDSLGDVVVQSHHEVELH